MNNLAKRSNKQSLRILLVIMLLTTVGLILLVQRNAVAAGRSTPDGKALFETKCATCHGMDAHGGRKDKPLIGLPEDKIRTTATNGVTGRMPSFKRSLGDDGINAVVIYVRSLK